VKVALVGSANSSRMLAPFGDPSWEIWACSPNDIMVFPRVTAWFEVHGDWDCAEVINRNNHCYLAWLREQPFIIYANRTDLLPKSIAFPAKQLVQEFGPYWFTSTFSWMFAFAISKGAEEIGLYGADMSIQNEYLYQRPAMHRWIEIAEAKGIKVHVPMESDLLQPPDLYGYSCISPMGRKLQARIVEMTERIAMIDADMAKMHDDRLRLLGVLEATRYMTMWSGGEDSIVDIATRS
jgi:hypothetical protein